MPRKRPRNKGGRPTRFTPSTALRLGFALGRGCTVEDAAEFAGVGVSTAYRWCARGRMGGSKFDHLAAIADAAKDRRHSSPFWKTKLWRARDWGGNLGVGFGSGRPVINGR
jgi:hypothetical protein